MDVQKMKMLIKQIRGVSYKPDDLHDTLGENSIILLRANNIADGQINFDDVVYVDRRKVSKEQILQRGDILICASSGSKNLVGKAAAVNFEQETTFGAFCKVVRPNCLDDAEYIAMYFQSPIYRREISAVAIGININNIRNEHIDSLSVNWPNSANRHQAVDVLAKIDSIIRRREAELRKLDDLIKARFVEMFGDPITNAKGYELKKYGDVFELNAGGTPSKNHPEYWEGGTISWIGSNMCQDRYIYENDGKYITQEGYDHSSARLFPINTVLVALVGATIGKTALLKFETTTNQNVLGIRGIRESGYLPEFVYYYTQGLYKKFIGISDGGFSMASKGFISELPIPVVSTALQEEFTDFANQVDKSKVAVQKALDEAQLLFDGLMQQYFG